MKFKLDEHLPTELLDDLRIAGHDAHSVVDEALAGATDVAIMAAAKSESRAIFTMDKGIANVVAYPPQDYAGIVLFRPHQAGRGAVLRFVRHHLPAVLSLIRPGALIVVSDHGIRIR